MKNRRVLFPPARQYATMRMILLWRSALKKLAIAVGVLILSQAYFMIPARMPDALDWILFVVLLLFGAYTIYNAMQAEK